MTEGCSVCGTKPAICSDKYDKATYYLCSGCLSERTAENMRLNQALDDLAKDCPNCNNVGYTTRINYGSTTVAVCCNQPLESGECCGIPEPQEEQYEEPYQEQCEFCHINRISRYNIDLMKIQAINGSDRDAAIKVHHERPVIICN